jgi:NADH dehydrogenase
MKIAITGGTGFIGRHLARDLAQRGHEIILIARGQDTRDMSVRSLENVTFVPANINNVPKLSQAFAGCSAVAICSGTSREHGSQTYLQLHVNGASNIVSAARQAGVGKLVLMSYLRARPNVSSTYHTTKWEGEEIIRKSGLDFTIVKSGLIYGLGGHLLENLYGILHRLPVFAKVGLQEKTVRLVAVEDLVAVLRTALLEDRLSKQTVAVLGPEEFPFSTGVRRIAQTMGKKSLLILPLPIVFHRFLAWFGERFMPRPLVAASQVQMLAEGSSKPLPDSQELPEDLIPGIRFTPDQIQKGLPILNNRTDQ